MYTLEQSRILGGAMEAIATGPPEIEEPPISDKKFVNGVLKKKRPLRFQILSN